MMVEMFTTKPPFWDCEPVAALFKIGAEAELDLRELIPDGIPFLTLCHRKCRCSTLLIDLCLLSFVVSQIYLQKLKPSWRDVSKSKLTRTLCYLPWFLFNLIIKRKQLTSANLLDTG